MGRRDTRNNRLLLHSTITENCNSNNLSYVQSRSFYITPTWHGQESSSKVEDTVRSIKEQKEIKNKAQESIVQSGSKSVEKVEKLTVWQKVKGEIIHYYHGFRLLGLDMKISAKLIWRILKGNELSRREHRLVSYELCITINDSYKLYSFNYFNDLFNLIIFSL